MTGQWPGRGGVRPLAGPRPRCDSGCTTTLAGQRRPAAPTPMPGRMAPAPPRNTPVAPRPPGCRPQPRGACQTRPRVHLTGGGALTSPPGNTGRQDSRPANAVAPSPRDSCRPAPPRPAASLHPPSQPQFGKPPARPTPCCDSPAPQHPAAGWGEAGRGGRSSVWLTSLGRRRQWWPSADLCQLTNFPYIHNLGCQNNI